MVGTRTSGTQGGKMAAVLVLREQTSAFLPHKVWKSAHFCMLVAVSFRFRRLHRGAHRENANILLGNPPLGTGGSLVCTNTYALIAPLPFFPRCHSLYVS